MLLLLDSIVRTPRKGALRSVVEKHCADVPVRTAKLRFVRWFLSLLTFCVALFSLSSSAQAAPIGMCSELGESIAAPPPLYAAKDIQLRGCESEEYEGWDVPASGRVPSGIDVPQQQLDKSFLLIGEMIIVRAPLPEDESTAPIDLSACEEHRRRLTRPPRS